MDLEEFLALHPGFFDEEPPRTRRRSLREHLPASIGDEYASGSSIFEIGKKYGVSGSTVANRLNDPGVSRYAGEGRASAQLPHSVVDEYVAGSSTQALGPKYGVSWATVANYLKAQGVKLRSPRERFLLKNPTKGKGHTLATKQKLREANIRQFERPGARELAAENQRRAMAEGRVSKTSEVEQRVAGHLDALGIAYERQALVRGKLGQFVACIDFKLRGDLVLEVQGDFWHANPAIYVHGPVHASQRRTVENDARKRKALATVGIKILYLWEHDEKEHGMEAVREVIRGA